MEISALNNLADAIFYPLKEGDYLDECKVCKAWTNHSKSGQCRSHKPYEFPSDDCSGNLFSTGKED